MLIIYAILTSLMIAVILSDTSRYIIPNWLVLALVVLYPVAVWLAPVKPDWMIACAICFGTFVVGLLLIARYMGGGDVKLLTAVALYGGKEGFVDLIVYTALLGGVGTLLLLLLRALTPFVWLKLGLSGASIPRVLTPKEPVPYGVAIAGAFLIMLWGGKLPGLVL